MSQVEIDEMPRLVRHKTTEIATYNAMPCCTLPRIELEFHCQHGECKNT